MEKQTWHVTLSTGAEYTVEVNARGNEEADRLAAESKALGLWDEEIGFSPGVLVKSSKKVAG